MTDLALTVSVITGLFVIIASYRYQQGRVSLRSLGLIVALYGLFFALFGKHFAFHFPTFGNITLGAATGGAVGMLSWVVIGTVGVATGGIGIALGALGFTSIGAVIGGIGGGSSNFGFSPDYVVTPLFWGSLIVLGLLMIVAHIVGWTPKWVKIRSSN